MGKFKPFFTKHLTAFFQEINIKVQLCNKLRIIAVNEKANYRTHAIITRGFYTFYPIFHCGLYCRAVYDAEWLIIHYSFISSKLQQKIE